MPALDQHPMTPLPSDSFVKNLRQLRRHRNLSQARLAEAMAATLHTSIDQSAITRIEQQTRPVRLDEAVAIAIALGVSIETMLEDADAPRSELEQCIQRKTIELETLQQHWTVMSEQIQHLQREIQSLRIRTV